MVNGSSSSLSESKFDYGIDGYLFEAKRSDDVTVVHFICAGDDINFKETGFGRLDLLVTIQADSIGCSTFRGVCLFGFNVALKHLRSYHDGACL